MPERDAITVHLSDGFVLLGAGVHRERSGNLTADLMLQNGRVLFADRVALNSAESVMAWAAKASAPDRPTEERLAEAIREYLLPEALAVLQEEPKKANQADLLVGMVVEELGDFAADLAHAVELFHDPGGYAYATIPVGDHRETWPLRSRSLREWMARRYHEQHGKTPNTQALVDATNVLAGTAIFGGPEHQVHVRLADHDGTIYFDLCNARWEVVAIDETGWRIVADPPVKFRRTRGMLPLPAPVKGGDLRRLREFLNLPTNDDAPWVLVVAWVIAALRPSGPYPVLAVNGEQGSAKSTLLRVLRALLDPSKAPIRTLPRDERDLMITATNGWCLAFDNLSHLQDWQSDALCRISTGGGFAVRELYSDQDETILDAQRPIVLNGIEEVITRNDLLDRAIAVYLPSIPAERRLPEKPFWRAFEEARPAILGALLDAIAAGIANAPTVVIQGHPRMADFAECVVATEPALPWPPGAFLAAYAGNQRDANDLTLEASPVAQALRDLMVNNAAVWLGTATDLLKALEALTDEQVRKQKSWPSSARMLSNVLRRLAPNLRVSGIDVAFTKRGRQRTRTIRIERADDPPSAPSAASEEAPGRENRADAADPGAIGTDDAGRSADDAQSDAWHQDSLLQRDNRPPTDGSDAADDGLPNHSNVAGADGQQRRRECVECGEILPERWDSLYCDIHGGSAPS